ncbi:PaRep2a protein, partial [Pyrobaculum aerophilum]
MRRIVNQQIRPEEGFLGDGGWRGKPMSCFVTGRKAVCKVGDKMAAFYVFDTPHGVY